MDSSTGLESDGFTALDKILDSKIQKRLPASKPVYKGIVKKIDNNGIVWADIVGGQSGLTPITEMSCFPQIGDIIDVTVSKGVARGSTSDGSAVTIDLLAAVLRSLGGGTSAVIPLELNDLGVFKTIVADTGIFGSIEAISGKFTNLRTEYLEANSARIRDLKAESAEITNLIASEATIGLLDATEGHIANLFATDALISNLIADSANIANLIATDANITNLIAESANIANLIATDANITNLIAENANIANLLATDATITNLIADNANIANLVAEDAQIEYLTANNADITSLIAENATIESLVAGDIGVANLAADTARIDDLIAGEITVTDLIADNADLDSLIANNASISNLVATNAEIDKLLANNISVAELIATEATIDNLIAENLRVTDLIGDNAYITSLIANDLNVGTMVAGKADINFANVISQESAYQVVQNLLVASGWFKYVEAQGARVGYLDAVHIDADDVDIEHLKVHDLYLFDDTAGTEGIWYQLNVTAGGVTYSELTPEMQAAVKAGFHGDNIIAGTVTADKIYVDDLAALNATIAGMVFETTTLGDSSLFRKLHTYGKPSVTSSAPGVFMDSSGQFSVGSGSDYVMLYQDANDLQWKLRIVADSISIGGNDVASKFQSLQDQIDDVIQAWFGDVAPTLSNYPASDWATASDKNSHVGDIYYDNTTGYAYRFSVSGSSYTWVQIPDNAVVAALQYIDDAVTEVVIEYAEGSYANSHSDISDSAWVSSLSTHTAGKYTWQRTSTYYAASADPVRTYACIQGAQGATGPTGPTGPTGNTGNTGETGAAGEIGRAHV